MSFYAGRHKTSAALVAADTLLHVLGSATARNGLCELKISSDAVPAEVTTGFQIVRTSSAGATPAGGNTTIVKLNTFGPAAASTFQAANGFTTEPTPTDVIDEFAVHQKATFRWVAYPGREYWSALTAAGGIAVVVVQQATQYILDVSCVWTE